MNRSLHPDCEDRSGSWSRGTAMVERGRVGQHGLEQEIADTVEEHGTPEQREGAPEENMARASKNQMP